MSARPNDFKLGLFVLAGLAILLGALFVFGASKLFERRTTAETYVSGDVHGLKVGAPVTLSGVPVGEVTQIGFSWNLYHVTEPRYVVVEFEIRNSVSLVPAGHGFAQRIQKEVDQGLRARIASQGLVGAALLSLDYVDPAKYPALPVPWTPRHVYIPSAPGQMSEIVAALDKTMSSLKGVDFQKVAGTIATNADQLLVELQGTAGRLDRVLANIERINFQQISQTVATNADQLLVELQGTAGRLDHVLANIERVNFQNVSTNANQLLLELRATAGRLDSLVANLDASSLGATLENVRRASRELDETIAKFRQYPSGVLFGRPPAPATSVEQPRR